MDAASVCSRLAWRLFSIRAHAHHAVLQVFTSRRDIAYADDAVRLAISPSSFYDSSQLAQTVTSKARFYVIKA